MPGSHEETSGTIKCKFVGILIKRPFAKVWAGFEETTRDGVVP